MKVLMISGSPRKESNTDMALAEMKKIFDESSIECEVVKIGSSNIRGCTDCRKCLETGKCVFDDLVNQAAPKFEEADGIVIGSPVYYAQPNASLTAFVQRLFFSTPFDKRWKVGAAVAVARRGGCATAFDAMNKYFGIAGMPIATSQYWNMVYGRDPGDVAEDLEGMQTMRTLARTMVFLMKSIALGKEKYGIPETEDHVSTSFIR